MELGIRKSVFVFRKKRIGNEWDEKREENREQRAGPVELFFAERDMLKAD